MHSTITDKETVIKNLTTIFNSHMNRYNNDLLNPLEDDFDASAMALMAIKELKKEEKTGVSDIFGATDFEKNNTEKKLEEKFNSWKENIDILNDFEEKNHKIISGKIGFASFNQPFIDGRIKQSTKVSDMVTKYVAASLATF